MKIRMTRNTRVDGKNRRIGDVVETDERTATYLIAISKAEPVQTPQGAAATVEQATVEAPERAVSRDASKGRDAGAGERPVEDVAGVGDERGDDLRALGIETVADLAGADVETLQQVDGVGKATAEKLRAAARKMLAGTA